jgi:hypothetical protein
VPADFAALFRAVAAELGRLKLHSVAERHPEALLG